MVYCRRCSFVSASIFAAADVVPRYAFEVVTDYASLFFVTTTLTKTGPMGRHEQVPMEKLEVAALKGADMNKCQLKNWKLRHSKRGSGRDSSP